jgi:hypothetical protein
MYDLIRRRKRKCSGKIFLLLPSIFIIGFSLLLAVFSLIHTLHNHESDGADACPVCERIASVHTALRQLDSAPRCAIFLFCAVYAAVSALKSACQWTDIQTLIALKIRLNV